MKFDEIYDSARPYIAGFVILRDGDKVAMVLRKNTGYMDGYYGLPSGKVEYGEPYTIGAVREAKEEAGVDISADKIIFVHTVHRHAEADDGFTEWVDVYFEASEWTGVPYNAEAQKSERLDWINIKDLPENIVPHQLDALQHISKNISYSEYGWN